MTDTYPKSAEYPVKRPLIAQKMQITKRRRGQRTTRKVRQRLKTLWLRAFDGNISEACRVVCVSRSTIYRWLAVDAAFRGDYEDALTPYEEQESLEGKREIPPEKIIGPAMSEKDLLRVAYRLNPALRFLGVELRKVSPAAK